MGVGRRVGFSFLSHLPSVTAIQYLKGWVNYLMCSFVLLQLGCLHYTDWLVFELNQAYSHCLSTYPKEGSSGAFSSP